MKPSFDLVARLVMSENKSYYDYKIVNYYFARGKNNLIKLVINLQHKTSNLESKIEFAIGEKD